MYVIKMFQITTNARILFYFILGSVIAVNADICVDIEAYIQEFQQEIENEKTLTPKAGTNYEREQEPMSLNAVVEFSSDTQRTFEFIAKKLNITDIGDQSTTVLLEEVGNCPSFKDLVAKCRKADTQPECDANYPYRTHDGTCNNLENPEWGRTLGSFRRILPPTYTGFTGFRESVKGGPLPEPRSLSLNIFKDGGKLDPKFSHFFMFFGQLIAHDTSDSALPKVNGQFPFCCPDTDYSECSPIAVSSSDPYFSNYNISCMIFLRNAPYAICGIGYREQINTVPAFLDLHFTYGRTDTEAKEFRAYDGTGSLKTQKSPHGMLMLGNNTSEDDQFCPVGDSYPAQCFIEGDSRTNQHTTLMALQTVFLREHNRMAGQLKRINPHWNGERIYQVARKILGAKMQSLVYNDYLPLLLGSDTMNKFGLRTGGRTVNHYDSSLEPSVSNEFSSFAFRLHSTVATKVAQDGCADAVMSDTYSHPEPIHEGCTGDYLKGASRVPQQEFGRFMTEEVTDFLLKQLFPPGIDLAAIDIQRGRDHGMAPYVDYVAYWSGGDVIISDFDDLQQIMSDEKIELLKENYADVRDVDVWVGMSMENKVKGSILGPTSLNLTVEHFLRQKKGDRFYFENQGMPNSFTKRQIEAIKQTSLSKIICDNTDVKSMLRNVLLLPGIRNPNVPCGAFADVNLRRWKEHHRTGSE